MDVEDRIVRKRFRSVFDHVEPRIRESAAVLGDELTLPVLGDLSEYNLIHTQTPFGVPMGETNFVICHKSTTIPKSMSWSFKGSHNLVIIGANVNLGSMTVDCFGKFGAVVISDGAAFKACRIAMKNRSPTVILGKGLSWVGGSIIVFEDDNKVVIGDNCLFSWDIEIMPTDAHPIYDRYTIERINLAKPIIIHEQVWIGKRASIAKGVELAKGTIIGQMSLVTKNTEPYCIYAGVPAKLIRRDVLWRQKMKNDLVSGESAPSADEAVLPEEDVLVMAAQR